MNTETETEYKRYDEAFKKSAVLGIVGGCCQLFYEEVDHYY